MATSIFNGHTKHSEFSAQKIPDSNPVKGSILRSPSVRSTSQKRNTVKVNENLNLPEDKHKSLMNYIFNAMYPHVKQRNNLIKRYKRISKDLAAVMHTKGLAEEREKMRAAGETDFLPDQRYPITQGHVDDIVTHMLQILFPARQMYGATEVDPDEQNIASAFVHVLNTHGDQFAHYKQYGKMLHDAIAFNHTGLKLEWANRIGWLAHRQNELGQVGSNDILQAGNKITCPDIFNTIWDYHVNPSDYPSEAQLFCEIERVSMYQLMKLAAENQLYGPKGMGKMLRDITYEHGVGHISDTSKPFYNDYWPNLFGGTHSGWHEQGVNTGLYEQRPYIRSKHYYETSNTGNTCGQAFDLNAYLGNNDEDTRIDYRANELLKMYVRLVPKEFGLSDSRDLQVWEIWVLNGTWIVKATLAGIAHGMMPVTRCVLKTEHGDEESKSVAERLVPFQDLISNTYNLYVKGQRKSVNNGLVFYDSERVKLHQMRDPTSGYVPVTRTTDAINKREPVSNLIHTVSERPEINTSINDIRQIKEIMQDIMPTDMLQTMADLNRATTHQSQTVSNAGSRRVFRLSRDISTETISPVNYMMTQNIIAFQQPMNMIDSNGDTIKVNPKQFRDSGIQVAVSDGLRGIDTVAIADSIQQVIQYALQSRRTHSSFDVVKMIEYMLHVQGATFDIEKFRFDTPFDSLDEEQKQMAFQLLQQAAQQQGDQQ